MSKAFRNILILSMSHFISKFCAIRMIGQQGWSAAFLFVSITKKCAKFEILSNSLYLLGIQRYNLNLCCIRIRTWFSLHQMSIFLLRISLSFLTLRTESSEWSSSRGVVIWFYCTLFLERKLVWLHFLFLLRTSIFCCHMMMYYPR